MLLIVRDASQLYSDCIPESRELQFHFLLIQTCLREHRSQVGAGAPPVRFLALALSGCKLQCDVPGTSNVSLLRKGNDGGAAGRRAGYGLLGGRLPSFKEIQLHHEASRNRVSVTATSDLSTVVGVTLRCLGDICVLSER